MRTTPKGGVCATTTATAATAAAPPAASAQKKGLLQLRIERGQRTLIEDIGASNKNKALEPEVQKSEIFDTQTLTHATHPGRISRSQARPYIDRIDTDIQTIRFCAAPWNGRPMRAGRDLILILIPLSKTSAAQLKYPYRGYRGLE
jgi:hypothetical protein